MQRVETNVSCCVSYSLIKMCGSHPSLRYVTEENRYDSWITRAPVCASLHAGRLVSAMMFLLVQLSLSPDPRRTMTECVSPLPPQPKRKNNVTYEQNI